MPTHQQQERQQQRQQGRQRQQEGRLDLAASISKAPSHLRSSSSSREQSRRIRFRMRPLSSPSRCGSRHCPKASVLPAFSPPLALSWQARARSKTPPPQLRSEQQVGPAAEPTSRSAKRARKELHADPDAPRQSPVPQPQVGEELGAGPSADVEVETDGRDPSHRQDDLVAPGPQADPDRMI